MVKKGPTPTDPKAVAAAMKRVMPLVKALPKEERLKESQILASALRGAALVHRTKTSDESGSPIVFGGDVVIEHAARVRRERADDSVVLPKTRV